jgi:hypothetical protein
VSVNAYLGEKAVKIALRNQFVRGAKSLLSWAPFCRLWIRPEASSNQLVSERNFIEDRWQPSGLIQWIAAKDTQNVSVGWTRKNRDRDDADSTSNHRR